MAGQTKSKQVEQRGAILDRALSEGRAALRRQARQHSPGEFEAEEALQEASIDFLHSYDGPPGTDAVRWLQVAVKYRAWEQGRRRKAEVSWAARLRHGIGGREVAADPREDVERAEAVAQFFEALARLKPDERIALLLLGFGCSYREIGECRGWTYTKVNRCVTEGRAALRALVD